VKESLSPKVKQVKIKSFESIFETCGAKIFVNNRKLKFISLYRPSNPKSNNNMPKFFENLENLLEKHRGMDDCVLAGDLNINMLDDTSDSRLLKNIFETYDMHLLNSNGITRVCGNDQGGTQIDFVFSSITHNCSFEIINNIFSDHKLISSVIDFPIILAKDTFRFCRRFSEANWALFLSLLANENWQNVYDECDVNEKSNVFINIIIKYFDKSFPLRKIIIRANQVNKVNLSTSTREIKSRLLEIDRDIKLSNNAAVTNTLRAEKRSLRKYLTFCINSEIKAVNDRKINESNNKSSTAWKIIKDSTGQKRAQNSIDLLVVDGKEERIKINIANTLNETFLVQPPNEAQTEYDFDDLPCVQIPFEFAPTSEAELFLIISKLAPKKSSGWDEISVHTLKKMSLLILTPLRHLVNYSFASKIFPNNMKISKILALFKKGETQDRTNYRPISITSSFSKVYEKVFLKRLERHFELNNLMNPQQHGFQRGKSTVTALFDFVQQVYSSMEAREKLNVILYDFSNAFGTLYPPHLLRKLKIYGISESAICWLESFLTHREQYVQMNDLDCDRNEIKINSERLISDMGVPQGTILGPTSFISYLNDISLVILIAILILFADDTTALIKGKTIQEVN
jgi:hypothetical protein